MNKLKAPSVAVRGGLRAGTLAVGCFVDRPLPLGKLPVGLAERIRRAVRGRGWRGERERRLELPVSESDAAQLSLYGLGRAEEFDAHGIRQWIDRIKADAEITGPPEILVVPPPHRLLGTPEGATALLRELALVAYRFDGFMDSPKPTLRKIRVLPAEAAASVYRRVRPVAGAVARGIALARDLANTPPNRATPAWMAGRARALTKGLGAKIRVLEPRELQRLGMAALLAVGKGSANSPRLVRIELGTRGPAVALVGKGVTFDSGGISIKPAAAMDEMKFDKAGACTVLGAVSAIGELDLPVRVRAYLPLAENMPSSRAYRPGDIIETRGGKTVEVLNTDAEGRLILADTLSLAVEEKPSALVEYSTLTGATVVALGHHGAALYSPDEKLALELSRAASDAGERLWRMPLWPEFKEEMKGRHADLRNVAGRWGGANTAAAFLGEFMGDCECWAHLDIAGTAWLPADAGAAFGATGYGVATTVSWLLERLEKG